MKRTRPISVYYKQIVILMMIVIFEGAELLAHNPFLAIACKSATANEAEFSLSNQQKTTSTTKYTKALIADRKPLKADHKLSAESSLPPSNFIFPYPNFGGFDQPDFFAPFFTKFALVAPGDNDDDGIPDLTDKDDDNDGILDTEECAVTSVNLISWYNDVDTYPASVLAPGTGFVTGENNTAGAGLSRQKHHSHNYQSIWDVAATTEAQAITNAEYVEYKINVGNRYLVISQIGYYAVPNDITTYTFTVRMSSNNFTSNTLVLNAVNSSSNGTHINVNTTQPLYLNPNTTYTFRVYFYNVSDGVFGNIGHDDFKLLGFVECDTDGDGIPNRLDLDSDGDGCYDAYEGDENVANSQLNANGSINSSVDANGVPTLVNSGGAADIGNDQGQGIGASANAAIVTCCFNDPTAGTPNSYTQVGISNLEGFANGWPKNVPNGFIAIESKNKGFVITRVANTAAIASPVEGMLIYDISASCIKLYNGTTWKCLEKNCNL